jgi:hypothetical protein
MKDTYRSPGKIFEQYKKLNIMQAKATSNIYFPNSNTTLSSVKRQLQRGLDVNVPGLDKADTLAQAFLASTEVLIAQQETLKGYYESKAYKEDNLVKGRAEHNALVKNYTALLSNYRAFDAELEVVVRKRDEMRAEEFKASGQMARYHVQMSYLVAQDILDAIHQQKADWVKADEAAKKLTNFIEGVKSGVNALPEDKRPTRISPVIDSLNRFLGAYRTYRETRKLNDLNKAISQYNMAISARNAIRYRDGD